MKSHILVAALAFITCFGCSEPPTEQPSEEPAVTEEAAPASSETNGSPTGAGTDVDADNNRSNSKTSDGPYPVMLHPEHIPNVVQVHEKVISGGLPEGDAGYQELADMGVKTVISVDGMAPEVETAKKHGLRYVHLPHGYDGIPKERARELAKAVTELDGKIYIHCHHGKHRSPAATSVACVTAGLISKDEALSILKMAGTNPNYRGLFESVEQAEPLDPETLNELNVTFHEKVAIPEMAEAMVAVSAAYHRLEAIKNAGWNTPAEHPDLVPVHEALMLHELYKELLRTDETQKKPEPFQSILREAESLTGQLQAALEKRAMSRNADSSTGHLDKLYEQISSDCKRCHQQFRDIPLSEKPASER